MSTLPLRWITASLGDIATFERGIAFPSSDKRHNSGDGLVACLRTTNVQEEVVWDDLWFIPIKHVKNDTKWLRVDDILISTANSQNLVGKVARVRVVPTRSTLGAFIGLLRARCEVSPALLHYKLGSGRFQELLRSTASQTTNIANLSSTQMLNLSVEVPPLNEQRRIVAKLDAIFEQTRAAKARIERLPAELEKLRRSILAAAFRGDLTKVWRAANPNVESANVLLDRIRAQPGHRTEGGLRANGTYANKATYKAPTAPVENRPILPEGWTWTSLGTVITSLNQGWSPKCETEPRTSPDEWAVMTTTAVQHNRFDEGANKKLPNELAPRTDAELRVGDLLITRAGPRVRAGVCCRVDHVQPRLLACDKVYRFRVDESVVLGEYVELLLNSPRILEMLEVMKTGISDSGVNLTQEKFTALMIPLAPIDEQRHLVRRARETMSWCERVLGRARSALAHISTLEESALAKAFRGELVLQDPNDEPASVLLDRMRSSRDAEPTAQSRGRAVPGRVPALVTAKPSNGHVPAPREDPLDLVIAAFHQGEPRLGATAIGDASGLDAATVKRALATLVDRGQVRVHGRARGTTYEWAT